MKSIASRELEDIVKAGDSLIEFYQKIIEKPVNLTPNHAFTIFLIRRDLSKKQTHHWQELNDKMTRALELTEKQIKDKIGSKSTLLELSQISELYRTIAEECDKIQIQAEAQSKQ